MLGKRQLMNGGYKPLSFQKEVDMKQLEMVGTAQEIRMTLEQLLYNLHKARENLAWMQSAAEAFLYRDAMVFRVAERLVVRLENAIRFRNAEICFQARQDRFRHSGLL